VGELGLLPDRAELGELQIEDPYIDAVEDA